MLCTEVILKILAILHYDTLCITMYFSFFLTAWCLFPGPRRDWRSETAAGPNPESITERWLGLTVFENGRGAVIWLLVLSTHIGFAALSTNLGQRKFGLTVCFRVRTRSDGSGKSSQSCSSWIAILCDSCRKRIWNDPIGVVGGLSHDVPLFPQKRENCHASKLTSCFLAFRLRRATVVKRRPQKLQRPQIGHRIWPTIKSKETSLENMTHYKIKSHQE